MFFLNFRSACSVEKLTIEQLHCSAALKDTVVWCAGKHLPVVGQRCFDAVRGRRRGKMDKEHVRDPSPVAWHCV